jgi:hypothetical protein
MPDWGGKPEPQKILSVNVLSLVSGCVVYPTWFYVHVLPLKWCRFRTWLSSVGNQLFGDTPAITGFLALPEKSAVPAYTPLTGLPGPKVPF